MVLLNVLLAVGIEILNIQPSNDRGRFIFSLIRVNRICWKGERFVPVCRNENTNVKTTCNFEYVGIPVIAFTFSSTFSKASSSNVPDLIMSFSLRFSSLRSLHSLCNLAMFSSHGLLSLHPQQVAQVQHLVLMTGRGHPLHLSSFSPPPSCSSFCCAAHTFPCLSPFSSSWWLECVRRWMEPSQGTRGRHIWPL